VLDTIAVFLKTPHGIYMFELAVPGRRARYFESHCGSTRASSTLFLFHCFIHAGQTLRARLGKHVQKLTVMAMLPLYIIALARSGDPDEDGFGETLKYAFEIECCPTSAQSGALRPSSKIARILLNHFENGRTHFDDGYEQILIQLCGRDNPEDISEMHQFFSDNMHDGNIWRSNINFGHRYLVFDLKEV